MSIVFGDAGPRHWLVSFERASWFPYSAGGNMSDERTARQGDLDSDNCVEVVVRDGWLELYVSRYLGDAVCREVSNRLGQGDVDLDVLLPGWLRKALSARPADRGGSVGEWSIRGRGFAGSGGRSPERKAGVESQEADGKATIGSEAAPKLPSSDCPDDCADLDLPVDMLGGS